MDAITSLADIEKIESIALDLPAQSTYELIGKSANAFADSPGLSFFLRAQDHKEPDTWSYRELFGQITATANFLWGLGVKPGDVVAYVLPNLPETHFVIWGAQAAGIAFAINPLLDAKAIVNLLDAGQARVLVTLAPSPDADLWDKLHPNLQGISSLRHVLFVNPADRISGMAEAVKNPLKSRREPTRHALEDLKEVLGPDVQIHDFAAGIKAQPTETLLSRRNFSSDDVSSYFCTGGTSGMPKIAVRTHGNEISNALSAGRFLGDGIDRTKRVFCGLPLFHVNAVLVTGLLPFSRGAHVVLGTPQGYRGPGVIEKFWEIVAHHRITFFSGVPTLYSSLLEQPIGENDIGSLEYGLCGAAPMPTGLMRNFQECTGLKIIEGYGLTEATCVSTCNPPQGERRAGSIGLRLPWQPLKSVVLDSSGAYVRDCSIDEVGTIIASGPNVFVGYRVDAHNRGLWVDLDDGRRWLNTGDLGRQDAQGYFYLTGRRKELIIRGGHNIDPAVIEEALHAHPEVQIAAAVGRPDAHAGEVPVAYVQLKNGASVSPEELLAFASKRIEERAAQPKMIRTIPAIPLTDVGKVFKPALKRREIASALIEALEAESLSAASLVVVDDPALGTCIDVTPMHAADSPRLTQVLGRFPFQVRLHLN
jgi:fatty-acyl-CoA synthase